jgi:hypothetical protein
MRVLRRCMGVLALAAAAGWGGTGCGGGYGSFCQDAMDCINGNDADVEACEATLASEEDLAELEGCSDEFDEYFTCVNDEARCRGDDFTPDSLCDREDERLDDCMH